MGVSDVFPLMGNDCHDVDEDWPRNLGLWRLGWVVSVNGCVLSEEGTGALWRSPFFPANQYGFCFPTASKRLPTNNFSSFLHSIRAIRIINTHANHVSPLATTKPNPAKPKSRTQHPHLRSQRGPTNHTHFFRASTF